MESKSLYQDLPPAAPVEKSSVIEDFVDVFYAPSKVFERRLDGKFGLALLLLVVILVVLYFATSAVMAPVYDVMVDQQVEVMRRTQPGLDDAGIARVRGMLEKTLPIGALVAAPIVVLTVGVVLWLVGKLFDSKQTIGQAMAVSTFANVPRFVLGSIVAAVQAFALGPSAVKSPFSLSLGAARFAPDASLLVQGLLNRFELFTLWTTFLLGLGLSITGRVPKRQAYIAAGIVWVLGTLVGAVQAMRAG